MLRVKRTRSVLLADLAEDVPCVNRRGIREQDVTLTLREAAVAVDVSEQMRFDAVRCVHQVARDVWHAEVAITVSMIKDASRRAVSHEDIWSVRHRCVHDVLEITKFSFSRPFSSNVRDLAEPCELDTVNRGTVAGRRQVKHVVLAQPSNLQQVRKTHVVMISADRDNADVPLHADFCKSVSDLRPLKSPLRLVTLLDACAARLVGKEVTRVNPDVDVLDLGELGEQAVVAAVEIRRVEDVWTCHLRFTYRCRIDRAFRSLHEVGLVRKLYERRRCRCCLMFR